jgi:hypothetical protein
MVWRAQPNTHCLSVKAHSKNANGWKQKELALASSPQTQNLVVLVV